MAAPAGRIETSANYQTLDEANRAPLTSSQRSNRNLAIRVAIACGFIIAAGIVGKVTEFDRDRPLLGWDGYIVGAITAISAFPLSGERINNRNIYLQAVGVAILWGTVFGGVALLNTNPAGAISLFVIGELLGSAMALKPVVLECRHKRRQNANPTTLAETQPSTQPQISIAASVSIEIALPMSQATSATPVPKVSIETPKEQS